MYFRVFTNKSYVALVVLLSLFTFCSDHVNANPMVKPIDTSSSTTESHSIDSKEVDDLNKPTDTKSFSNEKRYEHLDEESKTAQNIVNLRDANDMKYDVEVLEQVKEIQKENIELEEQFKGPALKVNTDNLVQEEIEVFANQPEQKSVKDDNIYLSLAILALALVSVGFYAAMVIWRLHLEQRYGMRELLVNNDENYQSDWEATTMPAATTVNNTRSMA